MSHSKYHNITVAKRALGDVPFGMQVSSSQGKEVVRLQYFPKHVHPLNQLGT